MRMHTPVFISRPLFALTLVGMLGCFPVVADAAGAAGAAKASREGLWTMQAAAPTRADKEVFVSAKSLQTATLDVKRLRTVLAKAPLDIPTAESRRMAAMATAPVEVALPMPREGKFSRFAVVEAAVMDPVLAAKYPDIKTYRGQGIDDPAATVAIDVTPAGFHAQIMSPNGWVYISPYYFYGDEDVYASYYKADAVRDFDYDWNCEFSNPLTIRGGGVTIRGGKAKQTPEPMLAFGGSLRTYRLACAGNGEYTATTGGTVASGVAAVVTVINRVSAIYENEVGIRLSLVANNNLIIYTDSTSDPYANSTADLNTNTGNLNTVIGSANYDIGHVFTTGSGGVAQLGCVCGTSKGAGTTGLPTPRGDAFNVDFVAHEMGHQFGGNHTFNGNTLNCGGGNRSATHAYEVGSGSTIMAYAGICGATSDLQPHSDAYFHAESLREILTFAAGTGSSCPVTTTVTDTTPVANAGLDYTIPRLTPFTLTGSGTDADGDLLTYCWEEIDRGAAQAGTAVDNGLAPIFRSFTPVYSPSRTFPKVSTLVNDTPVIGEQLPNLARTGTFRLTVRDNRAGGGATNSDDMVLTVNAAAGPFAVTAPNTAVTMASGGPMNVTWDVANTNVAPIGTAGVNILLSVDGGYTFPITLASATANDGTETVTLPAGVTTASARVKVAAIGNVYFDISNVNFTIN